MIRSPAATSSPICGRSTARVRRAADIRDPAMSDRFGPA
jgi:hypothetical protein